MIRSCLLSRRELKDLILKAPMTRDGLYFFPRFRALVLAPGSIKDTTYYYDRYIFKDKTCFSITDVKMFVAKSKMDVDEDLMRFTDQKLSDALQGLESLNLNDKVPERAYTLEELIDTCVYLAHYKYA